MAKMYHKYLYWKLEANLPVYNRRAPKILFG